ncbi:MAG: excinuclease ABC subunit UvrC [Leptospirales bacterium]
MQKNNLRSEKDPSLGTIDDLQTRLRNFPEEPGVYLMKSAEGEILYIGKSRSLKDRVRSYFQESRPRSGRISMLVSRICDIEIIRTKTELDALILENTLIKRHKPRYNVLLRDDKTYPYLRLSWNERFPRLSITRKVKNDGSLYFGPYANPSALRETLRIIHKTFPLATCHIPLETPTLERPCVEYQIHRCLGPCSEGLTTPEEYNQVSTGVRLFLQGKNDDLLTLLHNEMLRLAKALEFEKAALVRDRYQSVLKVMERQAVSFPFSFPLDALFIIRQGTMAIAEVLHIRNGLLVGKKEADLKNVEDATEEEIAIAFLEQFYGRETSFLPSEILLPINLSQDSLMSLSWMSEKNGEESVRITFPQRGDKKMILDLARENAEEALRTRNLRKGSPEEVLEEVRLFLNLPDRPETICCVDISNTGDSLPVASLVTFKDGKPDKSLYRKFRIRYERGQDDFRMLAEVMQRQFHDAPLPDLLVIDGGPGQLKSCIDMLKSMGHLEAERCVISLAKERSRKKTMERVFLPGQEIPRILPPHHPATHMLVHLRDEAHRFAIRYHRTLRDEYLTRSRLLDIPGIGPSREQKLIRHFGSIEEVLKASPEELMSAAQIPKSLAISLHQSILDAVQPIKKELPPETQ